MVCKNCDKSSVSWKAVTEFDEYIIVVCDDCGSFWREPNEQYLQARKRELTENYYEKCRRY